MNYIRALLQAFSTILGILVGSIVGQYIKVGDYNSVITIVISIVFGIVATSYIFLESKK